MSVEYITVEKEAAGLDGRIADMMTQLNQNISENTALENKLK